jgi:hypothetical protein
LSEDKGFLSRWSDRKLSAEQDEPESSSAGVEQAEEPADEFEGKSDDEILSILELPDPETLTLGDTVEKFMDGRVPERIRARALRAFWKTNPVLANLDGLDEYWDDYTDAVMVVENMQTLYQAGKGYASQVLDALESLADDESQTEKAMDRKTLLIKPSLTEGGLRHLSTMSAQSLLAKLVRILLICCRSRSRSQRFCRGLGVWPLVNS